MPTPQRPQPPPPPRRPRPAGRPTYIVDDLVDFGRPLRETSRG